MKPSHDVINISVGSYRFNGYKLKKDRDNNIIDHGEYIPQPGYWKTRAISVPDNYNPIRHGKN